MIVAIYGLAGVGKTTVARELGQRLGCAVRHCGEAVKLQSQKLGVLPNLLSESEHAKIDDATKAAVSEAGDLIVEGGFLDAVLANCSTVRFVELTCSEEQRLQRFACRSGETPQRLRRRNEGDAALKLRLYGPTPVLASPDLIVDTTTLLSTQAVGAIAAWLSTAQ